MKLNPLTNQPPPPLRGFAAFKRSKENPVTCKNNNNLSNPPIIVQKKGTGLTGFAALKQLPIVSPKLLEAEPSLSLPIVSPLLSDQLWTEKHRPKFSSQVLGNFKPIERLREWIQQRKLGNKNIPLSALISGPPGIGKTTIVHLLLKEAGFTILEVNASENRSGKDLLKYMQEVTKSSTNSFNGSLGLSLILDEIDGADETQDNGGIQSIIDFLAKSNHRICPVVCICNDMASRKVRDLANCSERIPFYRLYDDAMKKCLIRLCDFYKLAFSTSQIQELIKVAEGDARRLTTLLQLQVTNRKNTKFEYVDFRDNMFVSLAFLFYASEVHENHTDPEIETLLIHENWPSYAWEREELHFWDLLPEALSSTDNHKELTLFFPELSTESITYLHFICRYVMKKQRKSLNRCSKLPEIKYTKFFNIEKNKRTQNKNQVPCCSSASRLDFDSFYAQIKGQSRFCASISKPL